MTRRALTPALTPATHPSHSPQPLAPANSDPLLGAAPPGWGHGGPYARVRPHAKGQGDQWPLRSPLGERAAHGHLLYRDAGPPSDRTIPPRQGRDSPRYVDAPNGQTVRACRGPSRATYASAAGPAEHCNVGLGGGAINHPQAASNALDRRRQRHLPYHPTTPSPTLTLSLPIHLTLNPNQVASHHQWQSYGRHASTGVPQERMCGSVRLAMLTAFSSRCARL